MSKKIYIRLLLVDPYQRVPTLPLEPEGLGRVKLTT
jgi:hypothetical protein